MSGDPGPVLGVLEDVLQRHARQLRHRQTDEIGERLVALLDDAVVDDGDALARRLEHHPLHMDEMLVFALDAEPFVKVFVDRDELAIRIVGRDEGELQHDVDRRAVVATSPHDPRCRRTPQRFRDVDAHGEQRLVVRHQDAQVLADEVLLPRKAEHLQQRLVARHDPRVAKDQDSEGRAFQQRGLLVRATSVVDADRQSRSERRGAAALRHDHTRCEDHPAERKQLRQHAATGIRMDEDMPQQDECLHDDDGADEERLRDAIARMSADRQHERGAEQEDDRCDGDVVRLADQHRERGPGGALQSGDDIVDDVVASRLHEARALGHAPQRRRTATPGETRADAEQRGRDHGDEPDVEACIGRRAAERDEDERGDEERDPASEDAVTRRDVEQLDLDAGVRPRLERRGSVRRRGGHDLRTGDQRESRSADSLGRTTSGRFRGWLEVGLLIRLSQAVRHSGTSQG